MKLISHRKSLVPFAISRTGMILSYPPHQHDFFEVTYIHEGEGVHVLGGERSSVSAHDVLITPPGTTHAFAPSGAHDQTSIAFYPEFFIAQGLADAPLILEEMAALGKSKWTLSPDQVPDFERTLHTLFQETMFKGYRYERLVALECARLLILLERMAEVKKTVLERFRNLPLPLYSALVRIESDYHLLGDSFEVSTGTEVGPKHMIRLFKRFLKITPLQYLIRVRLEKCCELLPVPGLGITEAATRTGFNDIAHFNRLFKRVVGSTPTAVRNALLGGRLKGGAISRFGFPLDL